MKVSDLFTSLISTYNDWGGVLANPNYMRSDSTIAWSNFRGTWVDGSDIVEGFLSFVENRQYSFQIAEDGAVLQLYYIFDPRKEILESATLAFYKPIFLEDILGNNLQDETIEGTSSGDSSSLDSGLDDLEISPPEISSIAWIRMDYQPQHVRGVLHGECHLHMSGFSDMRLLVDGVPTPRQFIEMIVALCYPKIYRSHRLREDGLYHDEVFVGNINAISIPVNRREMFRFLTHILIPSPSPK